MSARRFRAEMIIAGLIVLLATGLAIVGIRAENTRDVVRSGNPACFRVTGPDATEADRIECERLRREARLTEPLEDSCIIQRRTLKTGWYERITRCPPVRGR